MSEKPVDLKASIEMVVRRHLNMCDDYGEVLRENLRLRKENARLTHALIGAWVDYDHSPYQIGTKEHERLPFATIDHEQGESVVHCLDVDAVQHIADGRGLYRDSDTD